MIDLVNRFFGKNKNRDSKTQKEETTHDIRIATCALLLEMSYIDDEFSESERDSIVSTLKTAYHLSDEYTSALIEASKKELDESIDLWQFTNLINRNYSIEEKIRVIETIWSVAYADDRLDKHEDYLVHKLAKLLHLTHQQLIEAKLRVK